MGELAFSRKVSIGNTIVSIEMKDKPVCTKGDTFVWGYPYEGSSVLMNNEWTEDKLNEVSGYFFAIRFDENGIQLVNDILGGYRIYYCMRDNEVLITDDYQALIVYKSSNENIEIDENQFSYWKKHRFTLNQGTLYKGIYKFTPASILIIDEDGINVKSYFKNIRRETNSNKLMKVNYALLKKQIASVYKSNMEKQIVLFYSGGADSTLLLLICRELNIPIKCILIKYLPEWSINENELRIAVSNLKKFNQKYEIIEVNLLDALSNYGDIAVNEMLFNRHLAVHFYQTYKVISEKYGTDIIVLNGQSADSILSFGPSEFTVGNYLKRTILALSHGPIGKAGNIVCRLLNTKFILPGNKEEASMAIMDDYNYIFALNRNCKYKEMLLAEVAQMTKYNISSFESMRMYSKIISFLQGSDNQIVIKAANYNGIKNVVMPFTSPMFIYNVIKYKNNIYEIVWPKYFVRDLLKKKYKYKKTKTLVGVSSVNDDFDVEKYEQDFTQRYIIKAEQIAKIH